MKNNKNNSKNLYELKRQNDRRNQEKMLKNQQKSFENRRIRNELGQKKSFFSFDGMSEIVSIMLTVAVSFVGTYFYLPWHGVLSAIPLVVISAFICAFIKTSELFKIAVFFISPFAMSLLLAETVVSSLIFGISCVLFYLLAYASVRLFRKKSVNFQIASAVVLFLSLGLHVFANSTPWSVSKSNKAIKNYVTQNYSGEPLYATDVKFNSFDRTYRLSLIPQHDARYALGVVLKDGKIVEDQYVKYAEDYNMIVGAGQITHIIRELFPDMKFKVEREGIYGYPFSTSASVIPKADYSRYMDFSVYFESYNSAKEFSDKAEKCYRELMTSGFYCRSITFYGGIGTRYVAKIEIPFNAMTESLEKFVEPCDNDVFLYTSLK